MTQQNRLGKYSGKAGFVTRSQKAVPESTGFPSRNLKEKRKLTLYRTEASG